MTHYRTNVRDIEFNLFEVLDRESILGKPPYADLDRETVSALLAEADHLARTKVAASFAEADREPADLRPADPHGDPARGAQGLVPGASRLRGLGPRAARRARRSGDAPLGPVGGERDQPRREPLDGPLHRRTEVRLRALGVRHRTGQADRPDHDRAAVGRDDGADRAGRRLRRRRRAHPGDPAAGRQLAPRGRQAVHHGRRARPVREHRPSRAGPRRSVPGPAPRACRCSWCRSSTSISRPAS